MTEHSLSLRRRTVLQTIGAGAILGGAVTGGAAAKRRCDGRVKNGESIQAAIDAADPGDIVCVMPGTYVEDVVIDRSGLTLSGRGNAVVEGTGHSGATISIEADDVTVRRLRVRHPDGNLGIAARHGLEGVTIRENRVSDIGPFGVHGPSGVVAEAPQTGLTIASNRVTDVTESVVSAQGIFLNDDRGAVVDGSVDGNEVRDVFIDDGGGGATGILVQTTGATIRDNDVQDLAGSWAQGVNVHGGNEATVIDNHLEGMTGRDFDGEAVKIEAGGANAIDVTENELLATVGVNNDSADELTATCNYWGARSGPDAVDNDGDGSAVVGNVEYRPWKVGRGRGANCRGGV